MRTKKPATKAVAKKTVKAAAGAKARTNSAADSSTGTNAAFFQLLTLVLLLCAFGLMMVLSSSSVEALRNYDNSWYFFNRQAIWLGLGLIVLYVAARIEYQQWRKWMKPMLVVSGVALFLVLVPGIGITVWGSTRWLGYGPLRFQPSEIAKFTVLVFVADLLSRRGHLMKDWRQTTRPVIAVYFVFLLMIMLQPDMGTTMVLGSIVVTALFVGGTPILRMVKIGAVAVAGAAVLAVAEPYRLERVTSFMDPFADANDTGYQMVQSIIGIATGGLLGVGLGESRSKWGFLPNAHTDFIYAIIAEELGLIGAMATVGLFIGFALLGIRTATRAPDMFGTLMAAGITAWVVFQSFLNIGAVIGIVPVTGVPLPFLSQGGTSLVILLAATGVLLNISRQGDKYMEAGGQKKSLRRKKPDAEV